MQRDVLPGDQAQHAGQAVDVPEAEDAAVGEPEAVAGRRVRLRRGRRRPGGCGLRFGRGPRDRRPGRRGARGVRGCGLRFGRGARDRRPGRRGARGVRGCGLRFGRGAPVRPPGLPGAPADPAEQTRPTPWLASGASCVGWVGPISQGQRSPRADPAAGRRAWAGFARYLRANAAHAPPGAPSRRPWAGFARHPRANAAHARPTATRHSASLPLNASGSTRGSPRGARRRSPRRSARARPPARGSP